MASDVITFGKYKGQPVEAMAADHDYCDWLMAQSWFRERHQGIYTLIVNNFQEPSETPEHNALQVLFLSDWFCMAVIRLAYEKQVDGAFAYIEGCRQDQGNNLTVVHKLIVTFEDMGADVLVSINWSWDKNKFRVAYTDEGMDNKAYFPIEIKPSVSDDYPAIIRQMRAIRAPGYRILFVGNYCGIGASKEQFVETFRRSGIRVVFRSDIL